MPRKIPEDLRGGIIAGILAGKTVSIIHIETGVARETIRYIAARANLIIRSRYTRVIPGNYWRSKRGDYWRTLNTQLHPTTRGNSEGSYDKGLG